MKVTAQKKKSVSHARACFVKDSPQGRLSKMASAWVKATTKAGVSPKDIHTDGLRNLIIGMGQGAVMAGDYILAKAVEEVLGYMDRNGITLRVEPMSDKIGVC